MEIIERSNYSENEKDYNLLMLEVEQILQIEDSGLQKWRLEKLAKKYNTTSAKLLNIYSNKVISSKKFEPVDVHDFLALNTDNRKWIIETVISLGTTILLYANGGVGKTLLAYYLCKLIAIGKSWDRFRTKQSKVLIVQTDEPTIDIQDRLDTSNFKDVPRGMIKLEINWQFSQTRQLKKWIEQERPAFVVIDSLTSANRHTSAEEKDAFYALVLYELRDIANEYECTIMVLHHENKSGGARGTTAIFNNVSEVWHLRKGKPKENLSNTQRILDFEKSRSGCSEQHKLELNVDDYSWLYQGIFESTERGNTSQSKSKKEPILAFLQEHPGIPYEAKDLASEFGTSEEGMRKFFERLHKEGRIETQEREKKTAQGNRSKYKAYLYPDLSNSYETFTTPNFELSDNLLDNAPIQQPVQQPVQQLNVIPDKALEAIGQTDSQIPLSKTTQDGTNSLTDSSSKQAIKDIDEIKTPSLSNLDAVEEVVESSTLENLPETLSTDCPTQPEVALTPTSEQPTDFRVGDAVAYSYTPAKPKPALEDEVPQLLLELQSKNDVVARILRYKTWKEVVKECDSLAVSTQEERAVVFQIVVKDFTLEEKQVLVSLLANHRKDFPNDHEAYDWLPENCWRLKHKANSLAKKLKAEELANLF